MSTRNSSGSSSPGSLHHSDGKHDSDTTPSPSGYRSPYFDPRTLSSRLALYEASKSLSVAAETLATAAQAMSKAAASLAVASDGFATKGIYDKNPVFEDIFKSGESSPSSGVWSPVWQQTSYVLSANNTVSTPASYSTSVVSKAAASTNLAHLEDDQPSMSGSRRLATATKHCKFTADVIHLVPSFVLAATNSGQENEDTPTSATAESECTLDYPQPQIEHILSPRVVTVDGNAPSVVEAPALLDIKPTSKKESSVSDVDAKSQPNKTPRTPVISTSAPNPNTAGPGATIDLAPPSDPKPVINPVSDAKFQPKFHLKLDHAFDSFPAVIFLFQKYPKSICFFKYWNAAQSIADSVMRSWVGRPVMSAQALKPNQQAKTITTFLQGPATVLLWPSDVALSKEALSTLASKSNVQAIHMGALSEPNKDVVFTQVAVITTVTEIASATAEQKKMLKKYPASSFNDACNKQGATSILEPHRRAVRASFTKTPRVARLLYQAFIVYHREHHPSWSVVQVVKQANEYAQNFLLRGEPGSQSDLIGGRIAVATKFVRRCKLEPAKQSGDLLVVG
ncbi:hypothetical protein FRC12_000470 [Ceratobasidium sp. 428]|nr:hypothetical protein FRC12_000470 [Ceratobasidium sp. 428]